MWTLAGHGVVRLVNRELEGVVTAETVTTVGDVTANASHNAWLARLEVGDCVKVPFTWTANPCGSEVNLAKKVNI